MKCEDYVEFLPEQVFEFFFQQCENLRLVEFVAPLDWLHHTDIADVFNNNNLQHLEVIILNNTSLEPMNLGQDTLELLLEKCPLLTGVGNTRTWLKLDYYDQESEFYLKTESQFSHLKKKAEKLNWDIDFDIETLDFDTNE